MGANLCCDRPSSPKKQPKERTLRDRHVCPDAASSRVDFIEPPSPPCSSKEKRKQLCLTTKADIPTLKDCMLASPATSPQIIKQLPKVICVSSPERRIEFFTPRNSYSSPLDGLSPGRLVMIDERDEDEIYEADFIKLPEETLEGCRLASPGGMLSPQFITESDFQFIKQLPRVIYMSSPTGPSAEFFTPRDSFCSPRDGLFSPVRAAKIGQGQKQFLVYSPNKKLGFMLHEDSPKEEEELASSSVTTGRHQTGKPRKKVSFNLPKDL